MQTTGKQKEINPPILSIVIPVYNNDRFLSFCLDSLLVHQITQKDKYELIVINDGSTDNSLQIIQSYAEKYSNVHVINQNNLGVSVARNKGIRASKGDYIWFVDGDDFVKENCIESILEKVNSGFDVYHFNGIRVNQEDFYPQIIFEKFEGELQPWFTTYVFSRVFLRNNSIEFGEGIRYCEDQLFMNDIMLSKPTCIIDNCIYYFYRRNDYSVSVSNRQKKIDGYFDLFELLEKRLLDNSYPINNTLGQIESILRMRFMCAMEDMSIVTSEQLIRGKKLSGFLYSYISKHDIPKKLKKSFLDYKKLCEHCVKENWPQYLYRWRKRYNRKKRIATIVKHPRGSLKKLINRAKTNKQ